MVRKYTPPPAGTWRQEVSALLHEFELWGGVTDAQANPNVPVEVANKKYAHRDECAVTVSFKHDGKPVTLTMDRWDHPPLNLKVIRLCVNDMRTIDMRGVGSLMASAYLQLEGPQGPVKRDPYFVLGIRPDASLDDIDDMYRIRAKRYHPDTGANGGDPEAFKELTEAYEEAKRRANA